MSASAKRGWLLRQIQYNSHKLQYILTLGSRGRGGGRGHRHNPGRSAGGYRPSQRGAGWFSGDSWDFSLLNKIWFNSKEKNIKPFLDPVEPDLAQQGFSKIAALSLKRGGTVQAVRSLGEGGARPPDPWTQVGPAASQLGCWLLV